MEQGKGLSDWDAMWDARGKAQDDTWFDCSGFRKDWFKAFVAFSPEDLARKMQGGMLDKNGEHEECDGVSVSSSSCCDGGVVYLAAILHFWKMTPADERLGLPTSERDVAIAIVSQLHLFGPLPRRELCAALGENVSPILFDRVLEALVKNDRVGLCSPGVYGLI